MHNLNVIFDNLFVKSINQITMIIIKKTDQLLDHSISNKTRNQSIEFIVDYKKEKNRNKLNIKLI